MRIIRVLIELKAKLAEHKLMGRKQAFTILALSFVLSVLFGQACGVVRPAVVNNTFLASGYAHSPGLTSCVGCHENRRPTGPVGLKNWSHTDPTYGGTGDCISCHVLKDNWGVSWAGGQFSHDPQPTTCVACHAGSRPTTLVGTPAFDHTVNGTGDCVSCHAKNTLKYDTVADWAGGEMMPTELIGNKSLSLATRLPVFTGSNLTAVNSSTVTLPLQMLHSTDQFPQVDPPAVPFIQNCTACHTSASSGRYTNGMYHSSLSPAGQAQPAACLECHTNTMPVGFVGPIDANRSPQSGPMRHEAVAWSDNGTGVWTKTTNKLVTQDCATCHKSPGGSWASAKYHANLTTQPSSCLDCHSNSRPVGSFGTPLFDHSRNGGNGDCIGCHTVTSFNSRSDWANGNFSHTGVTSCSSCHEAQRPVNSTGWQNVTRATWSAATTRWDLTKHSKGTDCYQCHSGTVNHTALSDFKGGNFNHVPRPAACIQCHSYPIGPVGAPATDHAGFGGQDCNGCHTTNSSFTNIIGWSGASSTPTGLVNGDMNLFNWTYWTVNPILITKSGNLVTTATQQTGVKLPMQMNHYSSSVANLTNCNACHTVGRLASSGTRYHTSIATQPTANCLSCHSPGGVPTGIVGPLQGDASGIANMNHATTSVTECSTCHKQTGTRWSDGTFHSKVAANTLTKCVDCHYPRMPKTVTASKETFTTTTGVVMTQHMSHTASQITQDCQSCHSTVGPIAGNTAPWNTGVSKLHAVIPAANLTTCSSCHTQDKPGTTVYYPSATANKRYVHVTQFRGDKDCYTCHTKKATSNYTDITSIGVTWAKGLYNHQDANGKQVGSTTCSNCHTGTGFYKHENLGKTRWRVEMPCMTCHATAQF